MLVQWLKIQTNHRKDRLKTPHSVSVTFCKTVYLIVGEVTTRRACVKETPSQTGVILSYQNTWQLLHRIIKLKTERRTSLVKKLNKS